MPKHLLPTTVVGSYPQPDWLVNREMLSKTVPRVRMEIWRVPEPWLEQAQDDATIVAIRDMERAGIDIITDGEIRRESYSNRFATALEGIDTDKPGDGQGAQRPATRRCRAWSARSAARAPVEVRDMQFLRRHTDRIAKITLPGPFTMTQQAKNEFYEDEEEMVMDYAVAVNEEARDLEKAGRRCHPARRAVAAQRSRGRQALRRPGHQSRARRPQGADRRAPVLRLCGAGAGRDQARRLLVPAAARRQHRRSRSRSRRRSPSSTSACSRSWRGRRCCWA